MTAKASGPGWYIPDLRNYYDEKVEIKDGVMYRKKNVLQIWWTHNTLGKPFDIPVNGRETWTMPTESDAIESFVNNWATDGF